MANRLAVVMGAAVVLALVGCGQPGGKADLKPLAKGQMAKLEVKEAAAPVLPFTGPDGRPQDLSAFRGKVAVVNLWATWCAPCKIEMPTLAALQAAYAGKDLVVAPISLDREDAAAKATAFIAEHKPLAYRHAAMDVAFKLDPPAMGLPTTLILDRQGRVRARISADADWSGGDARAVIDALLAETS